MPRVVAHKGCNWHLVEVCGVSCSVCLDYIQNPEVVYAQEGGIDYICATCMRAYLNGGMATVISSK